MKKYKTTCALIINDAGEVLLIKRDREPYKNCWALVSGIGASKEGKSPQMAVLEEVRCDLSTELLNSKKIFSTPVTDDPYTDEVIVFLGNINTSELKVRPGFSSDYRWISLASNKENFDNLAFEHGQILRDYIEGNH
jgi:8-oxo-dGTP diphosphatase